MKTLKNWKKFNENVEEELKELEKNDMKILKNWVSFNNEKLNEKKISTASELSMDNLGELPIGFVKMHYESYFYNCGYDIIDYQKGKARVDKKKLQEFMEKVIIGEGVRSLQGLQEDYDDYLKSKTGSKVDKLIYNIENKRDKIPNILVTNTWTTYAGKIGSTGATFQTFRKTRNDDNYFSNPINGCEVRGVTTSKPKPISELPRWDAVIYKRGKFDDGDKYKIMPANEITKYLSRTDDEEYFVYKI